MRYFLLAAHATRRTPRPHRGLFKRLCLLNVQVLALCACLEMQGIKRCFGERDHISWSQEFRSPNRVINAARLFDSCSYTTALPVAKSSQSQSCILQNTLPNFCFFFCCFFSLQKQLHFLMLNRNFCCTNTSRKQTCLHCISKYHIYAS